MISFFVPGVPAAQGSKKFMGVHGGRGIMIESSKAVTPWRAAVAKLAPRPDELLTGPVLLVVNFTFPRPKSHYRTGYKAHLLRDNAPRFHHQRPDLEKLTRAICDALTNVIWRDDSQVAIQHVAKEWAASTPGAGIEVHELGDPQ